MGRASDWLREERRKTLGDWVAFCLGCGHVQRYFAEDEEALEAFQTLAKLEGIIPALESAHAVAHAIKLAREMKPERIVIVNLSGRGDKDVNTVKDSLESRP